MLLPSRASRGLSGRFAEKVARDIEDRKPPTLFGMRLKVCLDEYLHRFLAGVHFDPERRIAEINLVAATVPSSDNGMRHDLLTPLTQSLKTSRNILSGVESGCRSSSPEIDRRCDAGRRQERVCGAQRLEAKIGAIAVSPGSRDRTSGL